MNSLVALQGVSPPLPAQNAAYLRLSDIEQSGNLSLCLQAIQRSNFSNLRFSKFRASVPRSFHADHQAFRIGVVHILTAVAPLKIVSAVVRLVSILVIYLMVGARRASNKCLSNEAMDKAGGVYAIFGKSGTHIAKLRKSRGKNNAAPNAPNKPGVRNLIFGFISGYRLPHFFHMHLTYLIPYLVPYVGAKRNQYKGEIS